MLSVLCIYLVNIYLIFSILYMLYRSLMARRTLGSRRRKGRARKHSLSPRTRAPPTTSTVPTSTTPITDATSAPPSPHTQEFVMIPNFGYVKSMPQPSFPQQPSPPPPPPLGDKVRTSRITDSAPSPIPSQPSSQRAQVSQSTPSQGSTNQRVELRYDGKSL